MDQELTRTLFDVISNVETCSIFLDGINNLIGIYYDLLQDSIERLNLENPNSFELFKRDIGRIDAVFNTVKISLTNMQQALTDNSETGYDVYRKIKGIAQS